MAERVSMPAAWHMAHSAALATALDNYIRERLHDGPFEPFEDEGWRLLPLDPVVDHVVKIFGLALVNAEECATIGETEVRHRRLSEVPRLMMHESNSMDVGKCIYERQGWPARSGGLERPFIEWAQADAGIEAFCKVSENRHDFARMRCVKDDDLPAFYFPDFLVRTADAIYMTETKSQQQTAHPNVQRKLKAAAAWCSRINALASYYRGGREWHYALVNESIFDNWRRKNARLQSC